MQLDRVDFKGGIVDVASGLISINSICKNLGIDPNQQRRKIQNDLTFGSKFIKVQTNGGMQDVFCIPLSKLNGWLFSINPNKVKPEVREKLIEYKNECFDALNDYFNKGAAFKPEVKAELENIILLQNEQIVQMDREINRLKGILIKLHDGFHAQLEKATNIFQLIGSTKKDGGNLNTETIAGHKYWGVSKK